MNEHDQSAGQDSSNSPKKEVDASRVNGLIDELRNVLSNLNQAPPRQPEPEISPNEKLGAPGAYVPPAPPVRETPSFNSRPTEALKNSDADFWNGNVLGWTANGAEDDSGSPMETQNGKHMDFADVERAFQEELQEPAAPGSESDFSSEAASSNGAGLPPFSFSDASFLQEPAAPIEDFLPKAPVSPSQAAPSAAPVPPVSGFSENEVKRNPPLPSHDLPDFVPEERIEVSLDDAMTSQSVPVAEVPIPGTVDRRAERPASGASAPILEPAANGLESPKPAGLVQIACLYAAAFEKEGQSFVSRLKELGAKGRKPVHIEAVHVHPWLAEKIDLPSWRQAAVLSGADVMFVVAPKKDQALFKDLAKGSVKNGGAPDRLVFVEHLGSQALFADILAQLGKEKNGNS